MIYAYTMENRALSWGIIPHIIDDFGFAWIAFVLNPAGNAPKLLSHTFLHANLPHLVANLVFFAFFGPAVEREAGHLLFAFLYLVWGAAAAVVQGAFQPYGAGLI